MTNLSIEPNSVDPDQTAPVGTVCSGSTQVVSKKLSKQFYCDWATVQQVQAFKDCPNLPLYNKYSFSKRLCTNTPRA